MSRGREVDGFTLVELLISTTIVGIVLSAVFGSMILYFNTVTDTTDRLSESPSLQIVSSWFGVDAQSAADFIDPGGCSFPLSPLVRFRWTDPGMTTGSLDNKVVAVAYSVENDVSNVNQKVLKRYSCTEGPPVGGVKTTSVSTVMNFISPVDPADRPALLCDGIASLTGSCSSTTKTVSLTFSMCTANAAAATCKRGSVPARVQGHRRTA